MAFTLFVILPNEDVCSLRNLASGTSIRAVRKSLELTAGLPAQTYRLTCPEGQVLHEDHELVMDSNVWDGYIVRAVFLDSWQELYDHIVAGRVDHVIKHGAVHMRGDVVWMDEQEEGRAREVMKERGVVALFVASFLGMQDMCKALLSVDVNPNGKTPFGRTPLFAALSRDNDLVMEQLLSHNAVLEARDCEGVTAVEVGRRVAAKQCLRKIRHLQLHIKGQNLAAAAQGHSAVRRRGPLVIRIPSTAGTPRESSFNQRESSALHRESVFSSASSNKLAVRVSREHSPDRFTVGFSGAGPAAQEQEGKTRMSQQAPQKAARLPQPKPLFRGQSREGETYSWDNNLTHVSRAPSAAGTQARTSVSSQRGLQETRRSASRSGKGNGVSWSDTTSVISATPKMLPFRPAVKEIFIKGPNSVLTTSTTALISSPTPVPQRTTDREETDVKKSRPSALLRFCAQTSSHAPTPSPGTQQPQAPHGPAQEPPGRPPTRQESSLVSHELEDQPGGGSLGTTSIRGSQEALSVDSAPELPVKDGDLGMGLGDVDQGESDDDGGRVMTSRGKGSRSSGRFRTRMLVSRQKQQESWRTMKRRLKLAEEQKRSRSRDQPNARPDKDRRENFDQWLDRKRHQQLRHQYSSDEDTSEDDEDRKNRSAEDSQAFNDWLKDLRERCLRPQSASPASLHRRKTRPLKNLIEVGGGGGGDGGDPVDPNSYMTAYSQWQHRKSQTQSRQQASVDDISETRKRVEEKRKSLLAVALTYQDWMDHTEQRKKLMQAILKADVEKLSVIEQHLFRTRRAPRQISFNQWREKVDRREAEIRHQRQRLRRETEFHQQNGIVGDEVMKSSAGLAHEQWVQQKKEAALKARKKENTSPAGKVDSTKQNEAAWEAWLEQKHQHEVTQLDQHLRQERQLLLNLRQKKAPTVTPC